ncbi:unnamed protein product, partial [Symbiodinium sp. KB8]
VSEVLAAAMRSRICSQLIWQTPTSACATCSPMRPLALARTLTKFMATVPGPAAMAAMAASRAKTTSTTSAESAKVMRRPGLRAMEIARRTAQADPMTDGACWTLTVVVSPLD